MENKKLRILYYNWTPLDRRGLGGGVSIYQRNIIEEMVSRGHFVYFVSSGLEYDIRGYTYYRVENDSFFGCRVYTIINSPVFSPAHANFDNIDSVLNDRVLGEVFDEILKDIGGVNVIHFNNLEGLSLSVVKLKKKYPDIIFCYSVHNYYAICPQVNLWKRESENCLDNSGGLDCSGCLLNKTSKKTVFVYYILGTAIRKLRFCESAFFYRIFVFLLRVARLVFRKINVIVGIIVGAGKYNHECANVKEYINYRRSVVECINENFDFVLCVSKRVKDICLHYGVKKNILRVEYIGTKFSKASRCKPNVIGKRLTFAYLGYMRKDKGFYFLIDVLESLPSNISSSMNLIIAAKIDSKIKSRLSVMGEKYGKITIYNGYNHDDMRYILKNANVGVVPVLWEDCLPQVAIEFYSHGCAVLSSDLGGARELSKSDAFVFKAGDKRDCIEKISNIVRNPNIVNDFFEKGVALNTMGMHAENLARMYYEGLRS